MALAGLTDNANAVVFISLIPRENICINPICTKPRLRGCIMAGLDRASPFPWQSSGAKCVAPVLLPPGRPPPPCYRLRLGRYGKAAGLSMIFTGGFGDERSRLFDGAGSGRLK